MNLFDLIINDKERVSLDDVFLDAKSRESITQLVKEHRHIEVLRRYGLPVNNKILLSGSSGCGKTTTARAIAHTLNRNILILNLSNIISARIGETSMNLKMLFDKAAKDRAVLFLDEFDQIGKARGNDDKDVGEMRRLVNTLLQMIDYFPEQSMLICATNHEAIIDPALLRRFQLRIEYSLPTTELLNAYYDKILAHLPDDLKAIDRRYGISYAEAKDYAFTSVKQTLITALEAGML